MERVVIGSGMRIMDQDMLAAHVAEDDPSAEAAEEWLAAHDQSTDVTDAVSDGIAAQVLANLSPGFRASIMAREKGVSLAQARAMQRRMFRFA